MGHCLVGSEASNSVWTSVFQTARSFKADITRKVGLRTGNSSESFNVLISRQSPPDFWTPATLGVRGNSRSAAPQSHSRRWWFYPHCLLPLLGQSVAYILLPPLVFRLLSQTPCELCVAADAPRIVDMANSPVRSVMLSRFEEALTSFDKPCLFDTSVVSKNEDHVQLLQCVGLLR